MSKKCKMYTHLKQYCVCIKFIMYSKSDDFLVLCFSSKWFEIQQRSVVYWKDFKKFISYIASYFKITKFQRKLSILPIFTRSRLNNLALLLNFPASKYYQTAPSSIQCLHFFWTENDFRCKWKSDIFLHSSNKSLIYISNI